MTSIKAKCFGITITVKDDDPLADPRRLMILSAALFIALASACTLLGGMWLQSILSSYVVAFALPIVAYFWVCALLMLMMGLMLGFYIWYVLLFAQIVAWMLI